MSTTVRPVVELCTRLAEHNVRSVVSHPPRSESATVNTLREGRMDRISVDFPQGELPNSIGMEGEMKKMISTGYLP